MLLKVSFPKHTCKYSSYCMVVNVSHKYVYNTTAKSSHNTGNGIIEMYKFLVITIIYMKHT